MNESLQQKYKLVENLVETSESEWNLMYFFVSSRSVSEHETMLVPLVDRLEHRPIDTQTQMLPKHELNLKPAPSEPLYNRQHHCQQLREQLVREVLSDEQSAIWEHGYESTDCEEDNDDEVDDVYD